jgi:hypothetical protein
LLHEEIHELHAQFGDFVRIGRSQIRFSAVPHH